MHNKDYWNQRYQTQQTGWDLGQPAPAIINFFSTIDDKSATILIPGCGNAHEAQALLDMGFTNITLIDIAPLLVDSLREKFKNTAINVILGDFFEHTGTYQYIVEQTFFCAIDPSLRPQYVGHMHALLQPGGQLVGLQFGVSMPAGPPFGGNEAEYQALFEPKFEVNISPCIHSVKPREGNELWVEYTKK